MNQLGTELLAPPHWKDLGVSAETHHTNYFQDLQVLNWLDRLLR